MIDLDQSAQGLNSSAHTQNSPPNSRILHEGHGSHKERLGRAQDVIKRLFKQLGTNNPQEKGWNAFIGIWKTSHWGYHSRPVRPVGCPQTGSGHSLKKTLSDGKFGLGHGHVWIGAR
jgi:hypothetical protein